jgi:hypothetical protein
MSSQPTLFDPAPARLPAGFRYQSDLITPDDEAEILRNLKELPFRNFEFHGYVGKRRVVSFGWRYDFNDRELRRAAEIPGFLCHCAAVRLLSRGSTPPSFSTRS